MYESAKKDVKSKWKEKKVDWVKMDEELYERFKKFCIDNGYVRDRLMNIILDEFLEKYGVKK